MPYSGDLDKTLNEYLDPESDRAKAIREAISEKYDFTKLVSYVINIETSEVRKTEIPMPEGVLHPPDEKAHFENELIDVIPFSPPFDLIDDVGKVKSKRQLEREAAKAKKEQYMKRFGLTEDWQLMGPYDTFGRKVKRWMMTHFGPYVVLRRIHYDVKNHHYVWNETFERRADVVALDTKIVSKASKERAVHVTAEPGVWFILDEAIRRPRNERENRFSAKSAYLYAKDNSFNEAVISITKQRFGKAAKPIAALWVVGAIVMGVVIYALMFA